MADMKYDWILDVIADLKTFTEANNMPGLSAELQALQQTAALEIARLEAADCDEENRTKSVIRHH